MNLKVKTLLISLFVLSVSYSNGHAFEKGDKLFSFGYGIFPMSFDNNGFFNLKGAKYSYSGPIYLKYESVTDEVFSLGFIISYGNYTKDQQLIYYVPYSF